MICELTVKAYVLMKIFLKDVYDNSFKELIWTQLIFSFFKNLEKKFVKAFYAKFIFCSKKYLIMKVRKSPENNN